MVQSSTFTSIPAGMIVVPAKQFGPASGRGDKTGKKEWEQHTHTHKNGCGSPEGFLLFRKGVVKCGRELQGVGRVGADVQIFWRPCTNGLVFATLKRFCCSPVLPRHGALCILMRCEQRSCQALARQRTGAGGQSEAGGRMLLITTVSVKRPPNSLVIPYVISLHTRTQSPIKNSDSFWQLVYPRNPAGFTVTDPFFVDSQLLCTSATPHMYLILSGFCGSVDLYSWKTKTAATSDDPIYSLLVNTPWNNSIWFVPPPTAALWQFEVM